MIENLSGLRSHEPTSNKNVNAYRFVEREIEIPEEWSDRFLRYAELHELAQDARKNKIRPAEDVLTEKQALHAELDEYLSAQFKTLHRSVLKSSMGQKRHPHERGKDSHVFFYGQLDDFLQNPDTPRYVTKHSVPEREVGPDNIEYLGKTYKLLRKLMAENIPRAWFIFGEVRDGIPKHQLGVVDSKFRAITIQREIRGKTFAQMTLAEKTRPEVVKAMEVALENYKRVKAEIHDAAKELGMNPKRYKISLDIGDASSNPITDSSGLATYSSPNVMFDERKKKIFFIDMGWGSWSPDKEKIYQFIMNGHVADEQKAASE